MMNLITYINESVIEGGPSVSLPLWQILFFVVLVSGAAIFGKHKTVVLLCYAFLVLQVLEQRMPVYTLNNSAVISVAVVCLIAVTGLLATCYHILHSSD